MCYSMPILEVDIFRSSRDDLLQAMMKFNPYTEDHTLDHFL